MTLRARFGIARPRLAVAGLNPHAGEDGALGEEDRDDRAPAVAQLRPRASTRAGRCRPTRCFMQRARATYDAALCMYHDQALIPIKTLAFDHAVNVTLGLPFVRTSPDHGTAFDIAGTGKADPSSLIAALALAARLAARAHAALVASATMTQHRRPAAAARRHPPPRPDARRNRSARTSCSISI